MPRGGSRSGGGRGAACGGEGAGRKLVVTQNLCPDNLLEDLDDLLIDDLTPENFISTVHVSTSTMAVAVGRQSGVSSQMMHRRQCVGMSSRTF
jgi:hypothetical protein